MTAIAILAAAAWIALYLMSDDTSAGNELSPGKYVALQHIIQTYVTAPGHEDLYVYPLAVNFSILQDNENLPYFPIINDSLAVMYIDGILFGEAGCHGGNVPTIGVYSLPYSRKGAVIQKVDSDGTATVIYKGQSIVLQPNQNWTSINNTKFTADVNGTSVLIEVSVTDGLTNYGVITR
jgi:hypothetical protein